jgi:hypothetical protein
MSPRRTHGFYVRLDSTCWRIFTKTIKSKGGTAWLLDILLGHSASLVKTGAEVSTGKGGNAMCTEMIWTSNTKLWDIANEGIAYFTFYFPAAAMSGQSDPSFSSK